MAVTEGEIEKSVYPVDGEHREIMEFTHTLLFCNNVHASSASRNPVC